MDEIWVKAVETALDGQTDVTSVRSLTLDDAVKCIHGRLPPPAIFDKFQNLQHLSLANIGVSSLEQFPRLRNLQRLILSDNRIAGGLEFLVEAGLESLRDLDLSNNRISDVNDLSPLAELRLVSLDLYECVVTRAKDYRSRVFGLIRSLKYLDNMDAEENERPESDEEEEDGDEEESDSGSGEIDGEENPFRLSNGNRTGGDGVVDVDVDDESDADEEETETSRGVNGLSRGSSSHPYSNGFGVVSRDGVVSGDGDRDGEDEEEDEGEEDDDLVDVYDVDDGEDDEVVEAHCIDDSDDEEDGVEYEEEGVDDEDDEDGEDEEEEEVDNDERYPVESVGAGWLTSTEGEIDGHERGEDDDIAEDDDGETGEEELAVEEYGDFEDEDDEDEDNDTGYLVQPVGRIAVDAGGSDMDPADDCEDPELEEEVQDGEVQELPPSSSYKRQRNEEDDEEGDDADGEEEDIIVQRSKSSKHH